LLGLKLKGEMVGAWKSRIFSLRMILYCFVRQMLSILVPSMYPSFEAVSGLKVNSNKCELVLVREVNKATDVAEILGCKVGQLPMTYLGLPLGSPHKARVV
jgi:hypothetical protein